MDFEDVQRYEGNLILTIETHLKAFVWLWNFLQLFFAGTKMHLIKDHLFDQMRRWQAIGSFNEEFMEADHVVGNWEVRKYASVRLESWKAQAVSKNESLFSNPAVQKIKQEVNQKRKKRRRMVVLSSTRREKLIERQAEVLEQVHQLMLMHSVDARRDSLDAATTAAQITIYWMLNVDNGAAQLKVLKMLLN